MTRTKRIYLDRNVSTQPGGQDIRSLCFEVSRQVGDDERPEPIGRPRSPDWDGYEYAVELVSGDVDWEDLEDAEVDAIEEARREWRAA